MKGSIQNHMLQAIYDNGLPLETQTFDAKFNEANPLKNLVSSAASSCRKKVSRIHSSSTGFAAAASASQQHLDRLRGHLYSYLEAR